MAVENLTELGVGGIFAFMIIREVVPPIIKAFSSNNKNGNSSDNNGNGNGYLKKTEFDKLAERVQYKDTCIEIVRRFDSYNNEQKERMEEQKNQITALSDKVENGFNALQKTIKNGNG